MAAPQMFPSIPDLARVFPQQDFNRQNILAQAQCAFILVLTGKKPNSADTSDDISDVSIKTIIHCKLKIIGIYSPPIASAGLALR